MRRGRTVHTGEPAMRARMVGQGQRANHLAGVIGVGTLYGSGGLPRYLTSCFPVALLSGNWAGHLCDLDLPMLPPWTTLRSISSGSSGSGSPKTRQWLTRKQHQQSHCAALTTQPQVKTPFAQPCVYTFASTIAATTGTQNVIRHHAPTAGPRRPIQLCESRPGTHARSGRHHQARPGSLSFLSNVMWVDRRCPFVVTVLNHRCRHQQRVRQ